MKRSACINRFPVSYVQKRSLARDEGPNEQIDTVYELYGLPEEEIRIVAGTILGEDRGLVLGGQEHRRAELLSDMVAVELDLWSGTAEGQGCSLGGAAGWQESGRAGWPGRSVMEILRGSWMPARMLSLRSGPHSHHCQIIGTFLHMRIVFLAPRYFLWVAR
jgi:hypothetical protein